MGEEAPITAREFNGAMESLRESIAELKKEIETLRGMHMGCIQKREAESFKRGEEQGRVLALERRMDRHDQWRNGIVFAFVTGIVAIIVNAIRVSHT